MTKTTPKSFILQLGSLIALYISVTAILILIFNVTNLRFPEATTSPWQIQNAREAVRGSIAMLAVFFPAFLLFTRLSNQDRKKYSHGEYNSLARWLVYVSILGGILILLGDMVTLINFFLNGEITQRFLIKVFALLTVVGLALTYYLLDIRGYFKKSAERATYFAITATALVILALLYGYTHIETPSEVREKRVDQQEISDLQDIQWRVEEWYRLNNVLPENISQLQNNSPVPHAPEGRPAYKYRAIDDTTYELCATFAQKSDPDITDDIVMQPKIVSTDPNTFTNYNWQHDTGEVCFTRVAPTIVQNPIKGI